MATFPQPLRHGAAAEIALLKEYQLEARSQSPFLDPEGSAPAKSQVICVASGKGGTGKTLVSTNLAVLLARSGLRTTLVDADFGLANAHLMLGIEPRHDIAHVVRREKSVEEIAERGPAGMRLVPGGEGRAELSLLSGAELHHIACELHRLEESSDAIVVDLGAGLSPQVLRFLNVAHDIVLVTDHEATARSDALGMIAALAEILGAATVHVVVNRARNREHAVVAFQHLWNRANKAWRGRIRLFFSGWLPHSWYVQSSVILGKPLVLAHPQSLPTRCLKTMAAKLHKHHLVWRGRQVGRWGVPSAFARLAEMTASAN